MSIKETIQKERLKLTSHTLRLYSEKFMNGEIPNPVETFVEIMINAPRDADRINAAKELKSIFFQRAPAESEVAITDNKDVSQMSREDMNRELSEGLSEILGR